MKQQYDLLAEASVLVKAALLAAHKQHEALGETGIESVQTNQFGDTTLKGDIAAEAAVLEALKASGLRITVYSEEHGKVEINEHSPTPPLLGVLDGIDGSITYLEARGRGPYGTLFALFKGSDPLYDDYLSAGIMQHATGELLTAARGKGVTLLNIRTGATTHPRAKTVTQLQPSAKIYVDNIAVDDAHPLSRYFALNDKTFARPLQKLGLQTVCLKASVAYYAAVAKGQAELVGESTRKGNLEIATAYGLIKEAGGVMVTLDGQGIGRQRFLRFGQSEHVPVLTAASRDLAQEVLLRLKAT